MNYFKFSIEDNLEKPKRRCILSKKAILFGIIAGVLLATLIISLLYGIEHGNINLSKSRF